MPDTARRYRQTPGGEIDHDADEPGKALQQVRSGRSAEHEDPHGGGGDRDWLLAGETVQPAGHRSDGDEGGGGEHERRHDRERRALGDARSRPWKAPDRARNAIHDENFPSHHFTVA